MFFNKIKSLIEDSIPNSVFFKKNNIIPDGFYLEYKRIKKNYTNSKNKIKKELENELVDFIKYFIMYNVEDRYTEEYILELIHEFGFDNIDNIISDKNDNIIDTFRKFNTIDLFSKNPLYSNSHIHEKKTLCTRILCQK